MTRDTDECTCPELCIITASPDIMCPVHGMPEDERVRWLEEQQEIVDRLVEDAIRQQRSTER